MTPARRRPSNPVPTVGGNNCCGTPTLAGPKDQRPVESRTDVLVYTSDELTSALQVNPYDVDGMAESAYRALTMDPEERRSRLAPLRTRVEAYDVHRWAATFLEQLETITRRSAAAPPVPGNEKAARRALHSRRAASTSIDAPLMFRSASPSTPL